MFRLGELSFDLKSDFLIMAILNRTPDSFFDKGKYFEMDRFLFRAQEVFNEGADIFDVGGVKAGPGQEVGEEEELDRVLPAISLLRENFDLPISVDTYRSRVLEEALRMGACLGNDISGFMAPEYLSVAARYGASVVATHIRLVPRVPDPEPVYDDLENDVFSFLKTRVQMAADANIGSERILIDPGLDLGKNTEQSLDLLSERFFKKLKQLGPEILLSASRKAFLGDFYGIKDVNNRLNASINALIIGYLNGARIFRVHDVKESVFALKTLASILEA